MGFDSLYVKDIPSRDFFTRINGIGEYCCHLVFGTSFTQTRKFNLTLYTGDSKNNDKYDRMSILFNMLDWKDIP